MSQPQVLKANNTLARTRNRKLMVLGSGVEEERPLLSKNEVGVQTNTLKENSIGSPPFSALLTSKAKLGRQQREIEGAQGREEQPARIAKLFRV